MAQYPPPHQMPQAPIYGAPATPFRPIRSAERFVVIAMIVTLVFSVIGLFFYGYVWMLMQDYTDPFAHSGAGSGAMLDDAADAILLIAQFAMLFIIYEIFDFIGWVLIAVAACLWIHKAMTNLKAVGIQTNISEIMLIAWLFIPFAWFWMPFTGFKELYQGSTAVAGKSSATSWRSMPLPSIMIAWWVAWSLWLLLWMGTMVYGRIDNSPYGTLGLEFFEQIAYIIAGILFIVVVKKISALQYHPVIFQRDPNDVSGYYPQTNTPAGYRPPTEGQVPPAQNWQGNPAGPGPVPPQGGPTFPPENYSGPPSNTPPSG